MGAKPRQNYGKVKPTGLKNRLGGIKKLLNK